MSESELTREREIVRRAREGREEKGERRAREAREKQERSKREGRGWRACMLFFSTPRVLIPESFKMAAGAESANDCLNR